MTSQERTVLVTGGAGYIGAHICKALASRGDRPVTLDDLSSGHAHAVRWGPLVQGDIRDDALLDRVLGEYSPDAVIHLAGSIEVAEGEARPLDFWSNNVGGAISLLSAMERAGCGVLVFSSTCATYGEPETVPITESEPQTPVSVYGRTKLAVERMLDDIGRASDLKYASLRYFNAAGASPAGDIGEEHDPESHLIPNALKAAAGIGGELRLFGDDYPTPDGTCVRDFIHVMDLADAHLAALDRLCSDGDAFACNIGTGQGCSVREILSIVQAVTGRPVPHAMYPRRPGDAAVLTADIGRAKALLGFDPKRSDPHTIVRDAWNFHASRWDL